MRGLVGLGVVLIAGVGAWFYVQSRDTPEESALDAGVVDAEPEVPFGNLQWTHHGPTPIPIQTHGWNGSGLRALVARDGRAHAVLREPSAESTDAQYALRSIDSGVLGEALVEHSGVLERVVAGSDSIWVVSANDERVLSWELGEDGSPEEARRVFSPADDHTVKASDFWTRGRDLVGAVLTERLVYATDERPSREYSEDPSGGTRVRLTGPRPTAVERWLTPVGGRARPLRIDSHEHPPQRIIDSSLVVGSAAGSAVLVFEAPGLLADPSDEPTRWLQVVRFDADGRELWRRTTPMSAGAFDPIAHLADDGTLEAAWLISGSIVSVTLSEDEPQAFRTMAIEGEINEHTMWLNRCGGESWLWHMHAPRGERTIWRHRIQTSCSSGRVFQTLPPLGEAERVPPPSSNASRSRRAPGALVDSFACPRSSLDDAEQIYRGILSHDGAAPTGSSDEGHNDWVDAYNGAHIRFELACNDTKPLVALEIPTEPNTTDRGLMLLD